VKNEKRGPTVYLVTHENRIKDICIYIPKRSSFIPWKQKTEEHNVGEYYIKDKCGFGGSLQYVD